MFQSLIAKLSPDKDYPERQFRIDVLTRVLRGTIYQHLPYDFHTEQKEVTREPIPIRERRPSVRSGLCKTVVDHSVSLLFAEGQFPALDCDDTPTREALTALIKETHLNEVMIEAATLGSVGSVAIWLRVLKGRIFFSVLNTQFLTPIWCEDAPNKLNRVIEQYKVKGRALKAQGYAIEEVDDATDYWFCREWDDQQETWYLPWRCDDKKANPQIDKARTQAHHLGFTPLVWVKNLPGGDQIDGVCTFEPAIDTVIEIDYQLSQAGRGLKYSSDPLLVIKEPDRYTNQEGTLFKSAANALLLDAQGDARLLEINGKAAEAVIGYVRFLRELALESIHGNRASADRIHAAQSGRAMELMNQPLIWLADKLRISYGEGALLSLLRMVVQASQIYPLTVAGEKVGKLNKKTKLSLRWPRWYAPTADDRQKDAHTLQSLTANGLLSRETALHILADTWDIGDVAAERQRIDTEMN